MLGVPYYRQWGPYANATVNDCGVACVAMLLAWVGRLGTLTVDALARETTLADSDTGLSCRALVTLGARHGLNLYPDAYLSLDRIREDLDSGYPAILLIQYGYIEGRADRYAGGHFVVAVGYDTGGFFIHDPDYATDAGRSFYVPTDQLQRAFQALLCQAVRINALTAKDDAIASLNNALAAVNRIVEGVPPAPAGVTVYCTTTKLNVRTAPGTTGAAVAWLAMYDAVQAIDAANGWKQLVGGQVRTTGGLVDVPSVAQTLYASGVYLSATRPT